MFPKIGVGPQNGWFIMENPDKFHGFGSTPIFGNTYKVVEDAGDMFNDQNILYESYLYMYVFVYNLYIHVC